MVKTPHRQRISDWGLPDTFLASQIALSKVSVLQQGTETTHTQKIGIKVSSPNFGVCAADQPRGALPRDELYVLSRHASFVPAHNTLCLCCDINQSKCNYCTKRDQIHANKRIRSVPCRPSRPPRRDAYVLNTTIKQGRGGTRNRRKVSSSHSLFCLFF